MVGYILKIFLSCHYCNVMYFDTMGTYVWVVCKSKRIERVGKFLWYQKDLSVFWCVSLNFFLDQPKQHFCKKENFRLKKFPTETDRHQSSQNRKFFLEFDRNFLKMWELNVKIFSSKIEIFYIIMWINSNWILYSCEFIWIEHLLHLNFI